MSQFAAVSIYSLNATAWTDSEQFEDEMRAADVRIDKEIEARRASFNPDQIITDWAEADAIYIALRGVSTRSATLAHRNILWYSDRDPESPWYRVGQRFYEEYCKKLTSRVKTMNPNRPPIRPLAWEGE